MASRRIYESSNGDTWDLMTVGDEVRVVHRSNLASGGTVSDYDLAAFLSHDRHSPQNVALVAMIGTLVAGSAEFR